MNGPFLRLWGWPLLLAVVTLVGLVSALLGDGVLDAVAWAGLGLPLALGAWHLLRRR
jgi:hypothetical protein